MNASAMKRNQERLFSAAQKFIASSPLVVWGSGATVPCGLPTMRKLAEHLRSAVAPDLKDSGNLEKELGDDKYEDRIDAIRQEIWNKIVEADVKVPDKILDGDDEYLNAIGELIGKIYSTHPQVVNFVTTNYDRVLEYVAAKNGYLVTDGTNMSTLSTFDERAFDRDKMVHVIKVHGSLSWFSVNGEVRYSCRGLLHREPIIIIPGKRKYRDVLQIPYRELIRKSDELIAKAGSVLVVGFGFNDEHITPELVKKVRHGVPVVVVTKNVTEDCHRELSVATKMLLIENDESRKGFTKVTYRNQPETDEVVFSVSGEYWKLNKFMEAI